MTTKSSSSSRVPDFSPPPIFRASTAGGDSRADSRTGDVYVFNDRIVLAVRVALATGRPLLVRGESGWGKSSLAASAARVLNWNFLETVITSRTQARDLQYELDLVLRLNDAHAQKLDPDTRRYIRPGVLWWALDPAGARKQQCFYNENRSLPAVPDAPALPGTVLLIDEIDKADPDVPNNLLVALGSLEFRVEETSQTVRADKTQQPPLVFITTNEERELPAAFLRRCIEITLPALIAPDPDGSTRKKLLVDVVLAHGLSDGQKAVTSEYADQVAGLLIQPPEEGREVVIPSPAEFKDTLLAMVALYGAKNVPTDALKSLAQLTLSKRRQAAR